MNSINYLNYQIKELNNTYLIVSDIFKNYIFLITPEYIESYRTIYNKLKVDYMSINIKIGMLKKLTAIYQRMSRIREFTHSEVEDFMSNISLIGDLLNLLILDLDIEREYLINKVMSGTTNFEIRRNLNYILVSISKRQKQLIADIYKQSGIGNKHKKRKMSFEIATIDEYFNYPMKKIKTEH
jgi:hypothetical protein